MDPRGLGRGAGGGGAPLAHNAALAALALQAGIAEWAAGKVFVTWSDPLAPPPSPAAVRRRIGLGTAAGAIAASLVVAVAVTAGRASFAAVTPAWGGLLIGALSAVLAAVRDELLLRGMVLKVARSLGGFGASVALCGAAGAAARLGADHVTAVAVLVEALRGAALGAVWMRDRGAWMAVGASTAWVWVLDAATGGALLDVRMGGTEPARERRRAGGRRRRRGGSCLVGAPRGRRVAGPPVTIGGDGSLDRPGTALRCPSRVRVEPRPGPGGLSLPPLSRQRSFSRRTASSRRSGGARRFALTVQPLDAKGQDLLGTVYFRLGLYPRAIQIYEALEPQFPRDTSIKINLALAYLKTGQAEPARRVLKDAVTLQPDHKRAWGYLGLALQKLGEFEQAQAAFERGGHTLMARRVGEKRRASLVPVAPPPPSVAPEPIVGEGVRLAAEAAFSELDAGELKFSLARPEQPKPGEAWHAVEPGSLVPVPSPLIKTMPPSAVAVAMQSGQSVHESR